MRPTKITSSITVCLEKLIGVLSTNNLHCKNGVVQKVFKKFLRKLLSAYMAVGSILLFF